ncbi:MAG: M23 family metallopeptidase [Chloroflexi bacterium]|nr:M23 family metallopeptidase [Chloroflexota bacterium]
MLQDLLQVRPGSIGVWPGRAHASCNREGADSRASRQRSQETTYTLQRCAGRQLVAQLVSFLPRALGLLLACVPALFLGVGTTSAADVVWEPGPQASGEAAIVGYIDTPTSGASLAAGGALNLAGWVVDMKAPSGTGIDDAHLYDGRADQGGRFLARGQLGQSRPDVATYFGRRDWATAGFSVAVPAGQLAAGPRNLVLYARTPQRGWWQRAVQVLALPAPGAIARPYRLPYGCGQTYEVYQGVDASLPPGTTMQGTHVDGQRYAVDFGLPEGTPVLASRGGTVITAKGDSSVGGFDPAYQERANYVVVDHGDGTAAGYWHLQFGSVVVQVGQPVSQGQVLARSGATGYVSGPHLHFYVGQLGGYNIPWPSVPAPLLEVGVNDGLPHGGESYASTNGCLAAATVAAS